MKATLPIQHHRLGLLAAGRQRGHLGLPQQLHVLLAAGVQGQEPAHLGDQHARVGQLQAVAAPRSPAGTQEWGCLQEAVRPPDPGVHHTDQTRSVSCSPPPDLSAGTRHRIPLTSTGLVSQL